MANSFIDGSTVMFDHTPTNGARVTLGIKSHNVDLTSLVHDVTNNKHGK